MNKLTEAQFIELLKRCVPFVHQATTHSSEAEELMNELIEATQD